MRLTQKEQEALEDIQDKIPGISISVDDDDSMSSTTNYIDFEMHGVSKWCVTVVIFQDTYMLHLYKVGEDSYDPDVVYDNLEMAKLHILAIYGFNSVLE